MDRDVVLEALECCEFCDDNPDCQRCPMMKDDRCVVKLKDEIRGMILGCEDAKVKTKCNTGLTWWFVCTECDESVSPGDKFCRRCGRRLVWDDAKRTGA